MTDMSLLPVGHADIEAAARAIAPFAVRTPLLSPPVLGERVGAKVFVKPEVLQRTGSFKFRGAFNKLSSIPANARGGGVVAFSSGNHAQGVAAAAQILHMRATIVMPADAPLARALGRDLKGKVSPFLYVAGIVAAAFSRESLDAAIWIALACFVAVAVVWLVPDRRIERLLAEREVGTRRATR